MFKAVKELSKKAKITMNITTLEDGSMEVIVFLVPNNKNDKSMNLAPYYVVGSAEELDILVPKELGEISAKISDTLDRINFIANSVKSLEDETIESTKEKKSASKSPVKKSEPKVEDKPKESQMLDMFSNIETKKDQSGLSTLGMKELPILEDYDEEEEIIDVEEEIVDVESEKEALERERAQERYDMEAARFSEKSVVPEVPEVPKPLEKILSLDDVFNLDTPTKVDPKIELHENFVKLCQKHNIPGSDHDQFKIEKMTVESIKQITDLIIKKYGN